MAIATQWLATTVTTSTAVTVYTTVANTVSGYLRDLVLNNSGTATVFFGFGASNVATTVASMQVPAGGTLILTQCQIPNAVPISAVCASGTVPVSIGYATNVAYI